VITDKSTPRTILPCVVLAVATVLLGTGTSLARDLTFEERVAAQEAIERVYYSHQIGTTKPFEEAVPREVLERKVRTYLKQSAALEQYWNTPVTAEALQREMERIVRNTRMPGRLREVYRALGNDAFLNQECLARPTLVNHLARSFFSADERIHAAARVEAGNFLLSLVRGEQSHEVDLHNGSRVPAERDAGGSSVHRKGGQMLLPDPDGAASTADMAVNEFGALQPGSPARNSPIRTVVDDEEAFVVKAPLSDENEGTGFGAHIFPQVSWNSWWDLHQDEFDELRVAAVAGDSLPLMSTADAVDTGSLDCMPGDTWQNGGSLYTMPEPRHSPVAVWTGSVMVVWGGAATTGSYPYPAMNTGGRYDPLTDSWLPMSVEGTPQGSVNATAVWTGSEMIVWGGATTTSSGTRLATGGRYDPQRDVWAPISTLGAPTPRVGHTAVWTGDSMIIWGGNVGSYLNTNTGARYDPLTDKWRTTSGVQVPQARTWHRAVWTGGVMVVWGGVSSYGTSTSSWPVSGGRYDPVTDVWEATTAENSPVGRQQFAAVWTGSEMVFWGGIGSCTPSSGGLQHCTTFSTGGRYDPETDSWTPTSDLETPIERFNHTAVWTGSEMLVWGGSPSTNTGGRYDPATDTWTPTSTVNAPSVRGTHRAVWTGDLMVIWGGKWQPDGGRYDPATDTWTPTSMPAFSPPRARHTAIWTGSEMVIWGGFDLYWGFPTNSGSRYDPALDRWTSTSTTKAPSARGHHSAVWTGSAMVVWGGADYPSPSWALGNTGGKYDPQTDSWSATTTTGAPTARMNHRAIWTGSRMILWGGAYSYSTYLNTGAQYDPDENTWTPVSTDNAPAARTGHSAVWTGKEMVVWGGKASSDFNSGGRYDPVNDRWISISSLGAPSARHDHDAVWTGGEMLVWGGAAGSVPTSSGARYDPDQDSWQAMSQTGAPGARTGQTAIWTGREMIIWGGQVSNQPLNSGGRYDPLMNEWRSTNVSQAPEGRWNHTAAWTGEMMIIWGGPQMRYVPTGGRYFPDPAGPRVAAEAGDDRTAECSGPDGTSVTLSGAGIACEDSASLAYSWSGPFLEGGGTIQGAAPTVTLPLGTSVLTLQVDDGQGNIATDTVAITVRDTTSPVLTCPSVAPAECSSPAGTPVAVPPAQVADVCDPHPVVVNSHGPGGGDASGIYPLGQTEVTMTATDVSGNQAGCAFPVTVRDTTPPLVFSEATPSVLWPPNHRMVQVSASVVATDACSTPTVTLASVFSSEPDDALGEGDGTTTDDIQGTEIGTADFEFRLRAERDGDGDGRLYEVVYGAIDGSGNSANAVSFVLVPHDVGKGFEYQWKWNNGSRNNP